MLTTKDRAEIQEMIRRAIMAKDPPLYRVSEVMKHFKITNTTVYAWIKQGKLRTVDRNGCRYVVGPLQ